MFSSALGRPSPSSHGDRYYGGRGEHNGTQGKVALACISAGLQNVSPFARSQAKGKATKAAKEPLGPSNAAAPAAGGKSIEEMYQKKTQLEHIILRPDTYIGSTERQPNHVWVHTGQKMEYKQVSYPPGLYKIFDEILVNAADNKVRDATMDTIKVDIDAVSEGNYLGGEGLRRGRTQRPGGGGVSPSQACRGALVGRAGTLGR